MRTRRNRGRDQLVLNRGAANQADSIRAWSGRTSILLAPGKKGGCAPGVEALAVDGEGLGRCRGGLSTKIHLAVTAAGCRCSTAWRSPGSDQAGRNADPIVWSRIRPTHIPQPASDGTGASGSSVLSEDQIARRAARGSRGGRPPAFDAEAYKRRNVVERCFNRLKQFRDLATRYAKRAAYYQAELTIAAIILWLR
ncbi:transposase [Amycolatopsis thermoflava]|uniref:transposase n=1 Tax=Amycolatopsis thermoflava TaxID=84480 RepID=UPI0014288B3A